MKRTATVITIVIFLFCTSCTMAQKSSWLKRLSLSLSPSKQNKSKLSADKLAKATFIVYHTNNGSVAPEWHYDCDVKVLKDNVNVTICSGYGKHVVYNANCPVTPEAYRQFLDKLLSQNIRNTAPNGRELMCGAGASVITVYVDQQLIFSGNEEVNLLVEKGSLADAFMPLLTEDMRNAVADPAALLSPR